MRAVVARERVEEDGERLQHEHVDVRGRDDQPAPAAAEPAAREREQRVHDDGEDDVRREHADRVGGRAVGLVQRR